MIIQFVLQTGVIVRGECDYTVCTTDRSHSEWRGSVIIQFVLQTGVIVSGGGV